MSGGVLYDVEVRVSPGLARGLLVCAILCLLSENTISENMTFSAGYPSPAGVYEQLTVTGVLPGGAVRNTTLEPLGGVGIRTGGVAPVAKLTVGGAMVLGINSASPGAALHLGGAQAGLSMATQAGAGARWTMTAHRDVTGAPVEPEVYDLWHYNGGVGTQNSVLRVDLLGRLRNMCVSLAYTESGPASCPTHWLAIPVENYSGGIPFEGTIRCCRISFLQ